VFVAFFLQRSYLQQLLFGKGKLKWEGHFQFSFGAIKNMLLIPFTKGKAKRTMKRYIKWILPLTCIILIEVTKYFPGFIEKYYSQSFYPSMARAFRMAFGWIPFSVGDVLIALLIIWVLFSLVKVIKGIKKQPFKQLLLAIAKKMALWVLWVYIAFFALWGLNYYREGSTSLLKLEPEPYTTADVDTLMIQIQSRLELACNDSLAVENGKSSNREKLAFEAKEAYLNASEKYPFLQFEQISLKPILLGKWQAYAGYAGYFFPFTGEAQADFYVPNFTLPFTVCHEMAHQLGFGHESEANLIGFLAARESENTAFVYSAYAGVHQYALVELYKMDSLKARPFIDKIPPLLKKDRKEQSRFQEAHTSILQPTLDAAYTLYMQGNNQPMGLLSYNRVVAWLVAYGKKYGWDKI
jgi:hypothetical protein